MAVDSKQTDAPMTAYTPVARTLHWVTALLVLILPIWREDRAFSERMFTAWAVGIALAALVAMHVAAALYHHFVRREAVRMLRG
jgi:cytochrome b561